MTIDVTGTYTVAAGAHLAFEHEGAFYISQASPTKAIHLTNNGYVDVSGASGDGMLTGVYTASIYFGTNNTFLNAPGAELHVSATGEQGYAQAIGSTSWSVAITNAGLIDVEAGAGANGIYIYGNFDPIENSGQIVVHGGQTANGVVFGGQLLNEGLIDVTADTGEATGVVIGGSAASLNEGRIVVREGRHADGGAAVQLGNEATFTNTGVVRDNHMAITEAYSTGDGIGSQTVETSGRIVGDIDLGAGNDVLGNSGDIRGDIYLRSGDDLYSGASGRHLGDLFGGSGADTLIGGKGVDVIFGDSPLPVPSDGDDRIEGGRGADILTGEGGADTFVYASLKDSPGAASDLITDLAGEDRIDLSGIDADRAQAGDQAFNLVPRFDGTAGEAVLIYDPVADCTRLSLYVNADARPDAVILLTGDQTGFSHFIL